MTTIADPDKLSKEPPLHFSVRGEGIKLTDEGALLSPICQVEPCVNPRLVDLMEKCGAKQESIRTWSMPVGSSASIRRLETVFSALDRTLVWPFELLSDGKTRPQAISGYNRRQAFAELFNRSALGARLWERTKSGKNSLRDLYFHRYHSYEGARANQMVLISSNEKRMWFKFATVSNNWSRREQQFYLFDGALDFNLWRANQRIEARQTTPVMAFSMATVAKAQGWTIDDGNSVIRKMDMIMKRGAVISSIPGSPGLGRLIAGEAIAPDLPAIVENDYDPSQSIESLRMVVAPAGDLLEHWSQGSIAKAKRREIDLLIEDVLAMEASEPIGRNGARHYQDEVISLHLATNTGLINACAPGLGKTFTTLRAWQEAAEEKSSLHSLVICPASIKGQWADETRRFFPEAEVRLFEARDLTDESKMADWRNDSGDKPTVAIISYASARSKIDTLCKFYYDEVACDEATVLRSVGSKQAKALHRLRQHAGRAVALTGTPIEGSLDDLGRILSWARNDRELFSGKKLSQRFNVADKSSVEELWQALGPTVFRRDRSEIASELPQIDTQVLAFDPTPEELALDEGARRNLRDILEARQKAIEIAAAANPDDSELQKAREEMSSAGGAILSGVTIARMAAADPVAVAHSSSLARDLLDRSGLIEPAVRKGGTKRIAISDLACDLAENGEGVLIFTDFSTIADNLVSEIESNGVRVSGYTGKMNGKERDKARRSFQGTPCSQHSQNSDFADENCQSCIQPTLDCLVLTEAGEEGLNLQRATTVIHFDLPWTASPVIQRVGRAGRIGSRTDRPIRNVIATMRGTIEERVAALLIPRAAVSLAALDTSRGVDASATEMGLALSGVEATISEEEKQAAGNRGLFDLAREVLG